MKGFIIFWLLCLATHISLWAQDDSVVGFQDHVVQLSESELPIRRWKCMKGEGREVVLVLFDISKKSDFAYSLISRLQREGMEVWQPMLDPLKALDSLQVELVELAKIVKGEANADRLYVIGLDWGGTMAFELATRAQVLDKVIVFSGEAPPRFSRYALISCPVYAFYYEGDHIHKLLPDIRKYMFANGKDFQAILVREGLDEGLTLDNQAALSRNTPFVMKSELYDRTLSILHP